MLKNFIRDSSYFQIIKNIGNLLTGYDFDNQFNLLINYIDDKIIPVVDNLQNNKINGTLDSDGYLLRTIGNKTTEFSRIRKNDIPDESISLDKLKKIIPNSILYCDRINLNYLLCERFNETVISNDINCNFNKITVNNIVDNTITSDKIALNTLTLNHINQDVISDIVNNIGAISTTKILDGALTSDKINVTAYTQNKISNDLLATRNDNNLIFIRQDVTGLISDNHIIKTEHISDNSVNFTDVFGNNNVLTNANIEANSIKLNFQPYISPYVFFNSINLLSVAYIKDNSFNLKNTGLKASLTKKKLCSAILEKLKVGGLVV